MGIEGPDGERRRRAMLRAFSSLVCETAQRAKFLAAFGRKASSGALPPSPSGPPSAKGGSGSPAGPGDPSGAEGDGAAKAQEEPCSVDGEGAGGRSRQKEAASGAEDEFEIEVTVPGEAGDADGNDVGEEWEDAGPGADAEAKPEESAEAEAGRDGAAGMQSGNSEGEQRVDSMHVKGEKGKGEEDIGEAGPAAVEISSSDEDGEGGPVKGERAGAEAREPEQALSELVDGYGGGERAQRLQRVASGAQAGGLPRVCVSLPLSAAHRA